MQAKYIYILASPCTPRIDTLASQADGLCVVTEMAQVDAFTTAHEVMARGVELNGLKVFIPKTFFHEDLLPPRQQKSMLG